MALTPAQERYWRAVISAENWMLNLTRRRQEIPLDLVRAYLMLRFGLRKA